ncbi:outer membrane protein [Chlorobium sp.]|uniref:outer membrane protein n=1 Tax=Chlorobium sp. TaxID=1095 RepID=UPI003C3E95B6
MKKLLSATACGLLALICSGPAANAATPYISGSAGIPLLNDSEITIEGDHVGDWSYDTGYALTAAIGLDSGKYRVEAEVGYQENDLEGFAQKVSMMTYLGNGYLDFELPAAGIKPFVSVGLGFATVEWSDGITPIDDTVFAWQIGAGVGFSVAPKVTIDAKYRYFATSNPELADDEEYSIASHNFALGMRIGF